MSRQAISTDRAPAAIGPYSQAIRVGEWLFLSGQIPIDPTTSKLVPGDIAAQARQVMHNLTAVLKAAGASFEQVVKTTIYLTDLADFGVVNGIYGEAFPSLPPARATIQVSALPLGAKVEIDAIALLIG